MDMLNALHTWLLTILSVHLEYKINMNAIQDKLEIGRIANLLGSCFCWIGLDFKAPVDNEKVCYVLGNW